MAARSRSAWLPIAAVFTCWAVAIVMVGVGGDFPLSDDWAYAHVVRSLLAGRGFDFLPWTGASVMAQAVAGAAACKLFGFSYVTLRVTTLAIAGIGIAAFHALLRRLGADATSAAAAAAIAVFSPLWFNLSFTFMTDVPFAALALVAAWLHVLAFDRRSRALHLVAGAAAAAAFLIRQHAVWISAAAALACLAAPCARRDDEGNAAADGWGNRIADALSAAGPPAVVVVIYTLWALTSASAPLAAHNKIGEALAASLLSIGGAAFRGLATTGFLFLPWALTLGLDGRAERRTFAALLAALAAPALLLFVREGATMFYLSNILADFSVGALTTRDTQFLALSPLPAAGGAYHAALTVASLVSAALLVTRLVFGTRSMIERGSSRPALFCILALALSALGSLAQAHYYFDRYLIVILPLAIAAVVAVSPPPRVGFAAATLAGAFAFYSVAGTHDYLAWNRARWTLLGGLEKRGITARKIDGGFEYNAERLAAELGTSPSDAQARRGQAASTKSWWWVVDDEWLIAFGPLEGYASADARVYSRWLPPGQGRVQLLHRETFGRSSDANTAQGVTP